MLFMYFGTNYTWERKNNVLKTITIILCTPYLNQSNFQFFSAGVIYLRICLGIYILFNFNIITCYPMNIDNIICIMFITINTKSYLQQ